MRMVLGIGQVTAAEPKSGQRRISGLVAPYGSYGNTDSGRYRIAPAALQVPEDLRRVKLFRGHDRDRPVGYATAARDDETGLTMDFRAAATGDGDAALVEASEGIRDAFSVELDDVTFDGDLITAARVTAVALVPLPAYADARVTQVAAADNGRTLTMPDATVTLDGDAPATVTFTPAAPAAPAAAAESAPDAVLAAARPARLVAAARPAALAAPVPGMRTLHEAASVLASWHANPNDPMVQAALADITYTGFAAATTPGWLGELWGGVRYQRQIVPLISSADLNSYKYTGWKWTTPPKGDTYAGDKAAIPSNTPVVAPVNLQAERWAGGHDIDRAWIDFNDTEFLDSYSREMADSYASYTDEDCLDKLVAGGTAMSAANLTDAIIDAIFQVGQANLVPTFVLLSPDLIKDWAGMTTATTPPLLLSLLGDVSVQNLLSISFRSMPAGTLIVGARSAAEFRELPGSPLRFDALELARGGVDRAFFGYHQTFVRKPAGIAVVTVGP